MVRWCLFCVYIEFFGVDNRGVGVGVRGLGVSVRF